MSAQNLSSATGSETPTPPVKYPNITVGLSGEDGNAFFILGRVRRAMRKANVSDAEIEEFSAEAMSGNYDHVLQTVMRTVETT